MTGRIRLLSVSAGFLLLSVSTAHAGPSPPSGQIVRLSLNVPIPLRDGIELSASIFRPPSPGPYPVIFVVTPYTADRWESWGNFFAENGYIFVSVDARGRGNSQGGFDPWVNEGRDGVDIIRVLARLPGSDGRVAAWGGSYSGKNQWAFGHSGEPSLKAIAPAATGYPGFDLGMLRNVPIPNMLRWLTYVSGKTANSNLNRDDTFWGKAYAELASGTMSYRNFDQLVGGRNAIWQAWSDHPSFDDFWRRGTPSNDELAAIAVPVLVVTGTYDDAQLGTLRYWSAYQGKHGPKPLGYLVIGPWDHPGTREPQRTLGGLTFGRSSQLDIRALNLQWYDWVLKHGKRPTALRNHVNYYIANADCWDSAPTLAAATVHRQTLFLSSPQTSADSMAHRGRLTPFAPVDDTDSYVDDPSEGPFNEGPEGGSTMGADFLTSTALMDRIQSNGLIYDSAVFGHAADLVGRPEASLHIALDAPDADFRVQLYEIRADGSAIFLAQDQIRARYRANPSKPELVAPGQTFEYRFDQFPFVARRIEAGSVIRLVIAPLSASIHQQRNRHSGKNVADETSADNRLARIFVKLGRSQIRLPFGRDLSVSDQTTCASKNASRHG